MKNFKKVLALVLAMTMVISTFAVSADTTLQNEDKAKKLYDLKLFFGMDKDSYVPALEQATNRQQAMVVLAQIFQWDIDEEATTEFEDVASWAVPYVAYAAANEVTVGYNEKEFGGEDKVTERQLLAWITRLLGYGDATSDKAEDDAYNNLQLIVDAGLITAEEKAELQKAVDAETEEGLIRDDLIGVFWDALQASKKDETLSIIESLVEAGKVDKEEAVEAGLVSDEFAVVDVKALNLVQTEVKLNQKAEQLTGEEVKNYELKEGDDDVKVTDASLSEDGKSVVLTHENKGQQAKLTLTVEDVKNEKGEDIKKYEGTAVKYVDIVEPKVEEIEVIGINKIKATFSEPMDKESLETKGNYEVEEGDLYIGEVTAAKNNTVAIIEVYEDLKEGTISVLVKDDVKDEAGFGVSNDKAVDVKVVPDDKKPAVVGFKNATRQGVTLIFDGAIELLSTDADDYYHTNSSNEVDTDGMVLSDDGMELELSFNSNPLPPETAYVYILKDAITDLWNNKNSQIMTKIDVEVDDVKPTVKKVEGDKDKVSIWFSEKLDEETATEEDNYTILKDGKENDIIADATYDSDDKKVEVTFTDDFVGAGSVVIENVKDRAGNKIDKTTEKFSADDASFSDDPITASLYDMGNDEAALVVRYPEEMSRTGKYSVLDLEKYTLDVTGSSIQLNKLESKSIRAIDNGKSVEIILSKKELVKETNLAGKLFDANGILLPATELTIGRVADVAGNTSGYSNENITVSAKGYIKVDSIKITGYKTIEVEFNKALNKKLDASDIELSSGIKVSSKKPADDGKKVVLTLTEEVKNGGAGLTYTIKNPTSCNRYGETLKAVTSPEPITDKLGAKLTEIDAEAISTTRAVITLTFNEDIKLRSNDLAAEDLKIQIGNKDASAIDKHYSVVATGNILTVTINDKFFTKFDSLLGKTADVEVRRADNATAIVDASGNNNVIKDFSEEVDDLVIPAN